MADLLRLEHVSKTFSPGTVHEKKAVEDLSLALAKGDFVTVIGSNGAGKSTLFGAIAGSFFPDGGKILLDGEDITFLPEHRRSRQIGRLFQDPLKGTAPHMTIQENLALAYLRAAGRRSPLGIVGQKERVFFRERLAALGLGLEERMENPVLMATLVTPKLLLLDEHTAALDPATAEKVQTLTKEIAAERGITCMMITHNISAALELGNRTLMMDRGRIVLEFAGAERAGMSVPRLLELFKEKVSRELDNDRMLL